MKHDKHVNYMILGLALILIISFFDGFAFSFAHMIQHLVEDFTVELRVHTYIAGWVLFLYGLYKYARKEWF